MPLQNRVNPFGDIFRTGHRGAIMGNRGGVIHRNKEIVRPFKSPRWITCLLEFKGRRRIRSFTNSVVTVYDRRSRMILDAITVH